MRTTALIVARNPDRQIGWHVDVGERGVQEVAGAAAGAGGVGGCAPEEDIGGRSQAEEDEN